MAYWQVLGFLTCPLAFGRTPQTYEVAQGVKIVNGLPHRDKGCHLIPGEWGSTPCLFVRVYRGGVLIEYYVETVCEFSDRLQKVSKRLLVDAYFSKYNFVHPVCEAGLDIISRLRDDSVLFYRYLGPKRTGRGRPRKFQGKVDVREPDENHFELIFEGRYVNPTDFISFK